MAVTLADVAESLSVSTMTVSRAVNNHPAINAQTRERVLEAVARLGYQPNHQARGLAKRRSFLIGLVVPDLTHSYFANLAKAIEGVSRPAGYELAICTTSEDPEREITEVAALRHRTDGLIIASSLGQSRVGIYRKLTSNGARILFIDRRFERLPSPSVVTDNILVGRIATEHLLNLGYQRIGHLRGTDVRVATDRLAGYRQALRLHKVRDDASLVRDCGLFEGSGYAAMQSWIKDGDVPRAIFAVNDPTAIGALTALHEAGVDVPGEVAVMGAGAIHYGAQLRTPLSTVDWDLEQMGMMAAQMLIELIESGSVRRGQRRAIVLPPRLVIRDSCGASKMRLLRRVSIA
jgi:LacI family transcriptional regulator